MTVKSSSTQSPRRSGRYRKPCSYKENVVKVLDYATEEMQPERFVYQITKNNTKLSRQCPRVSVSFAATNVTNGAYNSKSKKLYSRFGNVTPNHSASHKEEDDAAIISCSDTDESHDHDGTGSKLAGAMRKTREEDTCPIMTTDDTCENVVAKVKRSTRKRQLTPRQQTAPAALNTGLDTMGISESIITRSKPLACKSSFKKMKKSTSITTTNNKNNRTKEEPVKVFKLQTGTLYLYRGLNPRAEFVQQRR
mmetsp:Transcript_5478/g.7901  ORF Transcript_5478/g.7901 Transcript_5478/m.7901 type:complete len:251 (+) Transcript_5478:185-937(+)|eukprot:CAMPEP_0195526990 /NCGR_PEP_ID=MMETSP0794_2-20130614/28375_1 /TAXON_ID=515487 /ORGANISM="Stephanopyxis turris, Strain CCMP 815" /LENGTH=250 /DNA_ID=CAMNT_0040657805 /DNA_START=166 /DNA_END=918 /DNA_ORIENTATION=+